jgi:hypothetical protein
VVRIGRLPGRDDGAGATGPVHDDDLDAVQMVHDRAEQPRQRAVSSSAEVATDTDRQASATGYGHTPA